ncbi:hypothetical protein JMJ35_004424 [Cladonia borealis]|uniref:SRR1-like domain-containing protein n=1 Tax=Cladonia borealis TaxID=184061 RepID=A0AA39R220_9LECA|nr:hypothetical protein JMJ35_004424 [Cladonia borealis]
MPKRSTPQKQKRTRTTSPSGWTHITKGPTPHLPPHHTTALQHAHVHSHSASSPSNSTDLEAYISKFRNYYVPQWLASTCHNNLSSLFRNEIVPSTTRHNRRITNCICLGLGSFTSTSSSSTSTAVANSSWQLAALLSIVAMILLDDDDDDDVDKEHNKNNNNNNDGISERKDPSPFPIIFQDPIFTPTDITFLTEHLATFLPFFLPHTSTSTTNNHHHPLPLPVRDTSISISVVTDPSALGMIDEGTFLFAPHLEVGVFARALDGGEKGEGKGGPVVCVGSDLGGYVDGLLSKHAEEARAGSVEVFRRFRDGREEREMPGFERGDWCVALRVYWRKGRGDEEGREGEEGVKEMVRVMEGQRL